MAVMTNNDNFRYEPVERFGASMTSPRPWNQTALAGVELLNGRVAMLGFLAAVAGELSHTPTRSTRSSVERKPRCSLAIAPHPTTAARTRTRGVLLAARGCVDLRGMGLDDHLDTASWKWCQR